MLVKRHDRVGRMADTLEYADVAFPRARFTQELVDELQREAPSLVEEDGESLVVKHLYIERRMTPLNMYLDRGDEQQLDQAVRDYGNAIKELASVNIFPGDMLFKNFGITAGGRIVFYDYDEISYMTEVSFRRIPSAPNPEDEMSAEPWYPVAANDVFPEEFGPFLMSGGRIGERFLEYHRDLLSPTSGTRPRRASRPARSKTSFPMPMPRASCGGLGAETRPSLRGGSRYTSTVQAVSERAGDRHE